MAPSAKRRRLNGARRRRPLREVARNARWMHLHASEVSARRVLHTLWASHMTTSTMSMVLFMMTLLLQELLNDEDDISDDLDDVIMAMCASVSCYVSFVQRWMNLDHTLYDIPLYEELRSLEFRPREDIRLHDARLDDVMCRKMTRFSHGHLVRLYDCFGLLEYCNGLGETDIYIETGSQRNGTPNRYKYHPEEIFLFCLMKIATGWTNNDLIDNYFGGDYARWGYAYAWMLIYLDRRYASIIGHQGLLRFVHDFPRFHNAIEKFAQKDRTYHNHDGTASVVQGLSHLPFKVFGFIDDTIDRICVPFSGPDGDYVGAPRKVEYSDAQQSVFTGYKKLHGIKVETIYLPNGISTLFGPLSSRRNDAGVADMINLNEFLIHLQSVLDELFAAFGDPAFCLGLDCIMSYINQVGPVPLTLCEKRVNSAMKSARIVIEKNYGQTSCVFRICDTRHDYKLGKKNHVALEQLRVCHLMLNCYACLNGEQGSHVNTFGLSAPRLEEYLRL
jgi:hypothetical protein